MSKYTGLFKVNPEKEASDVVPNKRAVNVFPLVAEVKAIPITLAFWKVVLSLPVLAVVPVTDTTIWNAVTLPTAVKVNWIADTAVGVTDDTVIVLPALPTVIPGPAAMVTAPANEFNVVTPPAPLAATHADPVHI